MDVLKIMEHNKPGNPVGEKELLGRGATKKEIADLIKDGKICRLPRPGFRREYIYVLKTKECAQCDVTQNKPWLPLPKEYRIRIARCAGIRDALKTSVRYR